MQSITSFHSEPREPDGIAISRGLGWFSLALGATELVAPNGLAKAIGLETDRRSEWILRAFGVREIAAGVSILLQPGRPMPIWSRVIGDLLDLAMLAGAIRTRRTSTPRALAGLLTVVGATAIDVASALRIHRVLAAASRPVIYSVTINRPPQEVYAFYRRLDQLPVFMDYLESVQQTDAKRSHWVAKLPVGKLEWDAEITDDRPGELIEWRSVGSAIKLRGCVTFARAPGRDATEVRVEMELGLPVGGTSATLAKLFAKPQIKGDLRRLKQVLETGEVLRSDASAHTRPHPAQPALDAAPAPPIFVEPASPAQKGVLP